ncbi:TIGR00341 family protein [Hydrogenimonas urashimensis]|uniref:TIGR00341 family protein n=1 Tax=Hydrogenimonas urashimensis TaxID=2740515 RepID=UPI0019169971|nr:TIGR00341 family protein [Hydrogenimonas urashimensis]
MSSPIILLHDHRFEKAHLDELSKKIEETTSRPVERHIFKKRKKNFPDGSLIFVVVPDEEFREWLLHIGDLDVTIVLIPYEHNPLQQASYAIPNKAEEAIALAISESAGKISSHIRCDGKPVIGCVTVGASRWLERAGIVETVRRLFSMRLRTFHIKTAKEQEIKTAALMIEAGDESLLNRKRSYFFKASDNQCRRVAAVIYAPQSIVGALKLRLFLANKKREEAENLPPGIGTLKTETLTITSPDNQPFPFAYDGKTERKRTLVIESVPMKAAILTGASCVGGEEKESVRIQNLPTDSDAIGFFSKKPLPLVPIADESAFAELFKKLRDSAKIRRAYLILLLVSIFMAAVGLFQNSSPTIIGAMILAPLMGPIIAFSMGAIRFDEALMKNSIKTVLFSVFLGLAASAWIAWSMPFAHLTDQMAMRTHPTLLDLAVAIFAGIAAAYGYANSKVGESLAGVAIAVALVPPLCVSGIGIGWGSWSIFSNALLLFLANIVGIVVASGAMFYLMGYASRKYVSTAFFIKLMMVAVIAIPLWLSTRTLLAEEHIYSEFSQIKRIELPKKRVQIQLSRILHKEEGTFAVVTITAHNGLTPEEKSLIARQIKTKLGENVGLIFNFREIY